MDPLLYNFLRPFKRTNPSFNPTHISLFNPAESYCIEGQHLDNFFELYNKVINDEKQCIIGIGEMAEKFVNPIIVDVDLKMTIGMNTTKLSYNQQHVTSVIKIYQKVLKEIINDIQPQHLFCLVLEKEKPKILDNKTIKNGFHLHFINTFLSSMDYDLYLIPKINKYIKEENVFGNLNLLNPDSAIDSKVVKNTFLLYGSRKLPTYEAYKLTKIYDDQLNQLTLDDCLIKSKYKYLSYDGTEIILNTPSHYNLSRILSIRTLGKEVCKIKQGTVCELKSQKISTILKKIIKNPGDVKFTKKGIVENLFLASELVSLLSSERSENYDKWIEIGCILYSIGEGSSQAFKIWDSFSKRSAKYDQKETIYKWSKMKKYNYSIGSLRYFAEMDSPIEYKKFQDKHINTSIKKARDTNGSIAKIMYKLYGNRFLCMNIKKGLWYHYINHSWSKTENGLKLHLKMDELKEIFLKYYNSLNNNKKFKENDDSDEDDDIKHQSDEEEDEKEDKSKKQLVLKILKDLESTTFCNNVMKKCILLFSKENINQEIDFDSNPKLFGFKNGVYDFIEKRFREGKPEDYLHYHVNYDYEEFYEDSQAYLDLDNYLLKVFPDPQLRQYFLEYCADLLVGGNKRKIIMAWTADGNNAKSVTVILLEHVFGPYLCKIPTSFLTSKRNGSSNAAPELSRTKGKRIAIAQEPDEKQDGPVNVGKLKELAGNDSQYLRGLYEEGEEMQIFFKILWVANKLPNVITGDIAFWERVRVLPFESKFVDPSECKESFEEQLKERRFPKDPEFYDKVRDLKVVFMWKIIQVWHRVQQNGYTPDPEKVRAETKSYQDSNDTVLQFITDKVELDEKGIISLDEFHTEYVYWLKDNCAPKDRPLDDKKRLKEILKNKWGVPTDNKWIGKKIKQEEEQIKAKDVIII